MTRAERWAMAGLLLTGTVAAQSIEQLKLDHLAARAKESTVLTLDASTLESAARQMQGDEAKAKALIANVKGIAIRSYEFERTGEYSAADVEQMRRLFQGPDWKRVVGISSKADGESFEVFSRTVGGKTAGMAMLSTEAKELTLVYMDGAVDLGQLKELGLRLGQSGAEQKGKK